VLDQEDNTDEPVACDLFLDASIMFLRLVELSVLVLVVGEVDGTFNKGCTTYLAALFTESKIGKR